MVIEPRHDAIEHLERLIEEAAGSARKTRLLAERILHELTFAAQACSPPLTKGGQGGVPASRRCADEESVESDAESGWRLAA